MRTVLDAVETPTPAMEDVDATLAEVLGLAREMRCAAMAGLMRQDVSIGQLHVLWLLEHHGELSMTRLAELLGVSLSTATGLMDRMEERGLIERGRVPDDRRRVFVRPGPAGRLALEQTEGLRRERLRAILARLESRQLRRVARAARDVRSAVGAGGLAGSPDAAAHRHFFTDDA